jgi:L-ribulose-5-phosphate 4-epimerase
MLEELKRTVCRANLRLVAAGLVQETFGNVSAVDRASGRLIIKPSGVAYDRLRHRDMVVVSLSTGQVVEGRLKPSSDTPTHRVLYRAFPTVGGIAHTHSLHATAWAQARRELPPLGTTHADYFPGPVPCTRLLRPREIAADYEANTGRVIVERLARLDPLACRAVLVASHGPFTWGRTAEEAVEVAVALELVAGLASATVALVPRVCPMSALLLRKHFLRKHGAGAYYGQKGTA